MFDILTETLRKHKLVFGSLPLLGISYQGTEKDAEYRKQFSDKNEMKAVIKASLKYGVKFFTAASHGFNELAPIYLEAVREVEDEEETELLLIPCMDVPLRLRGREVDDYKRWKTHLTYESNKFGKQISKRYLDDPVLNCRPRWKETFESAKPYNLSNLENELRIDWSVWEESVDKLSDYNVAWVEPGSETDFLAITRMDLLEELLDRTNETGHRSLLGSHHFGATLPLIEEKRVKRFDGYVTPINNLGVMMFPTKTEAEKAVEAAKKSGKLVIGIKPLAGGRIKPKEALTYVFRETKADACMIGVGSEVEAISDFQIAENVLASLPAQDQ
jgi:hypothetical protein